MEGPHQPNPDDRLQGDRVRIPTGNRWKGLELLRREPRHRNIRPEQRDSFDRNPDRTRAKPEKAPKANDHVEPAITAAGNRLDAAQNRLAFNRLQHVAPDQGSDANRLREPGRRLVCQGLQFCRGNRLRQHGAGLKRDG